MPYPQHPGKHREAALVTAAKFYRYEARHDRSPRRAPPRRIVLVFGSRWREYLRRKYGSAFDPRSGIYRISDTVGIFRISGPGAPFAAIVVEELAALGVRQFLIVGLAGSLRPDLAPGSFVVCTKALRDEGTSYHYAKPGDYAFPSSRLVATLERTLRRHDRTFAEGPGWTTDAPYRETVAELRHYRRMGILTVDMEASAVFTVARHLGRPSAALFVISDHLKEDGWEPRFRETTQGLRLALQIALEALGH